MVRLVSGLVLATAALAAILFLPTIALRVLACAVAGLAAREFLHLTGTQAGALVAVVLGCWFASLGTAASLWPVVALCLVVGVAGVLPVREGVHRAAAGAFAVIYIGVPMGLLVALHARHGWQATIWLLATVVVSDSAQYYTGRTLGRHLLAPQISPKKTIEGALGGLVFGTVFVVVAGLQVFPGAAWTSLALLGIAAVALGIVGDLFESQVKREAGAKDSSHLIPGHGGVLDRIDALLFVAPAFYVYLGGGA